MFIREIIHDLSISLGVLALLAGSIYVGGLMCHAWTWGSQHKHDDD